MSVHTYTNTYRYTHVGTYINAHRDIPTSGMGNLNSGPKLYVTCPAMYKDAAG